MLSFEIPRSEKASPVAAKPLLEPKEFILKYKSIAELTPPISEGRASWYGPNFHGRLTASGEHFDKRKLTAAHPSLPFGTLVWVENKQNGKGILVRINDRGPYAANRIIDLSQRAAEKLGMIGHGVTNVQLFVVEEDELSELLESKNSRVYTIQLGIFKSGEQAFKYAEKISGSRVEVFTEHNQKYYGVFYGRYFNKQIAFSKKEQLEKQQYKGHVRLIEIN